MQVRHEGMIVQESQLEVAGKNPTTQVLH